MKALIFDVDGTLAETEEAHRAAFNAAFAAHGLNWHWSVETYRILLRTTGGKERVAAYQAGLPSPLLDAAQIAALHADKTARYTALLVDGGLALRPGVGELIDAARAAGLRLAVATTTSRPNVEALAMCCWGRPADEVFEIIAAGDEVAAKKPAPDVFQLALTRLGLPAADCLAFEDSRAGLASAKGAGLRVVLTPSTYTMGDDFTGADLLADTMPDLATLRAAFQAG